MAGNKTRHGATLWTGRRQKNGKNSKVNWPISAICQSRTQDGKPAYSDIAELVYRTSHDEIGVLHFGGDASYMAHLIAGTTEVPSHYLENKVLDTDASWLWIYDDDDKTLDLWNAKGFEIYRAGEMGLLIRFK